MGRQHIKLMKKVVEKLPSHVWLDAREHCFLGVRGCLWGSCDGKNGGKTEYSGSRALLIGLYGRKWIKGKVRGTEDNCHFSHRSSFSSL